MKLLEITLRFQEKLRRCVKLFKVSKHKILSVVFLLFIVCALTIESLKAKPNYPETEIKCQVDTMMILGLSFLPYLPTAISESVYNGRIGILFSHT